MSRQKAVGGRQSQKDAPAAAALSPVELSALLVAAKSLPERRGEVLPGQFAVDFAVRVRGALTVAQDSESSSSVTPDAAHVIAWVLSQVSANRRHIILNELPELFEKNANDLPAVDTTLQAAVTIMLTKLRRKVVRPRKGALSGDFQVDLVR